MASMYQESLRAFLKPILPYLDDESVSEIMINGPTDVWIEKKGKLFKTDAKFTVEGIEAAARNMAQFVGRVLNDERPRLDARLPDGSRIHVVMPPIARKGTTISIRKFFKDKLSMQDLVRYGSLTESMVEFLKACVMLKLNTIVSGGTGSGKTTFLNILSTMIPNDERILTIEDSAELQLQQEHLVPFESRPPDKLGKGGVDMGDLLQSALRLRPDRIVVGEVRGGECFHLIQAMNTGHGGSLATTHANTPVDTLRRLESLCLMSSVELPMIAVRAQVAAAIQVVVCTERLQDGSRRTMHIAEVLPLNEKGDYRTQDLFVFTPTGKDEEGRIHGYHAPTGIVPTFFHRLAAYGFEHITESFFDPVAQGVPPPPVFTHDAEMRTRWVGSLKHREEGRADPEAIRAMRPPPPRAAAPAPKKEEAKPAAPPPAAAKPAEPVKEPEKPAPPAPGAPQPETGKLARRKPLEEHEDGPAEERAAHRDDKDEEAEDEVDPEFERQMAEEIARAAAENEGEAEEEPEPPPSKSQPGVHAKPATPAKVPERAESGPNIRIAPDLLEEAEEVMDRERTIVRRAPVAPPTRAPRPAAGAPARPAPAGPAKPPRR